MEIWWTKAHDWEKLTAFLDVVIGSSYARADRLCLAGLIPSIWESSVRSCICTDYLIGLSPGYFSRERELCQDLENDGKWCALDSLNIELTILATYADPGSFPSHLAQFGRGKHMKGTHGQARKEHSELRLRRKQLRRTLEEIYSRDNLLMALTTSYSSKVLSEQEIELGSAGLCQIGRVAKIFADLTDRVVFLEGEYSDPGRTDREGLAAILDSMQTLLVCVDENRFLTDFIEKILGAWENQRGN